MSLIYLNSVKTKLLFDNYTFNIKRSSQKGEITYFKIILPNKKFQVYVFFLLFLLKNFNLINKYIFFPLLAIGNFTWWEFYIVGILHGGNFT